MQHGAGVSFALGKEVIERAQCDAIVVDDEQGARATSRIPAPTRRRVFERDEFRCRFPGCRSSRNLDIHHLKHQADGVDHRTENLALVCGGHHKLHHDGVIDISGDANGELVFTRNGVVIRADDREAFAAERDDEAVRATKLLAPKRHRTSNADGARSPSRYREVERNTLAKAALQQSGFQAAIAARAVERALAHVPTDAPLEILLKEAFRHCN